MESVTEKTLSGLPEAPPEDGAVDMVQVPREVLLRFAGKAWDAVVAAAEAGTDGLRLRRIKYGVQMRQEKRETWRPPVDTVRNVEFPYLPLNHAWLRKIDGRAFLYLQNW